MAGPLRIAGWAGLLAFALAACEPAPPPRSTASGEAPLVEVPNAARPLPGLLTGGAPSPEQLKALADAGFKKVIDLRTDGELGNRDEGRAIPRLGMIYVQLPIAGPDDLTVENARALGELLADPVTKPTFLHCASGNRVGALLALKAFHLDGATADEALALGRKAGLTRLEGAVKARLTR